MPSYTVRELEQETGFGRRTIAYYVQEGLLPRIGRRGPRSRYPEAVRHRLLFIRRVREEEEAGKIGPVRLSDLREVLRRSPPRLIAAVARGRAPIHAALDSVASAELSEPPDFGAPATGAPQDAPGPHVVGRPRELYHAPETAAYPPQAPQRESLRRPQRTRKQHPSAAEDRAEIAPESPAAFHPEAAKPAPAEELGTLLHQATRRRRRQPPGSADIWSEIKITPNIRMSVRGATERDVLRLGRIGRILRGLLADERGKAD